MSNIEDLHRAVGNIEGKLDQVLDNQHKFREDNKNLDGRLSSVEQKIHWYSGVVAVFAAGITFFGDKIRGIF